MPQPTTAFVLRPPGPRADSIAALLLLMGVTLTTLPAVAADPGRRGNANLPSHAAADPEALAPDLEVLQQAFQDTIARIAPSVVAIRAHRNALAATPLDELVGDEDEPSRDAPAVINGCGSIIRADGAILTNEHVVRSAGAIDVILNDGRVFSAMLVGADARGDLAILDIDADGLQPITFAAWDKVGRGQWSLVLGNPYGLGRDGQMSFSIGVIANLDRRLSGLGESEDRLYADMIQTTAPIHPGNSGGPLLNLRGEQIGIITAVHSRSVDDAGVGFAIPLSPARQRIINQLLEGRPVRYGYLGLTVRELLPYERADLGLGAVGLLVQRVDPRSAAADAGVRAGDVITHFDQQPLTAALQFVQLVGQTPIGTAVTLQARRDGQRVSIPVTVTERQAARPPQQRPHSSSSSLWRGMRLVEPDEPDEGAAATLAHDGRGGLVVLDVAAGSAAERARVRAGDRIERVNDLPVGELPLFVRAVRDQKGPMQLTIRDRGVVSISP